MSLDSRQKRILECGMELMRVQEELSALSGGVPLLHARPEQLAFRKQQLLREVERLSADSRALPNCGRG